MLEAEKPTSNRRRCSRRIAVRARLARLVHYENTVVEIDADSLCGGYVVLNDIWHPWWSATVDGEPAEILRANVLFRAVEVTPGRHRVRFEFTPVEGAIAELSERIFDSEDP